MPQFFIDRPVFAWVLAILITLGGALALTRLPAEAYPEIAPPQIERHRPVGRPSSNSVGARSASVSGVGGLSPHVPRARPGGLAGWVRAHPTGVGNGTDIEGTV